MISAREESTRLADLLGREHAALAEFLVGLADFDRKRRWLELGHASLFYFLHRELGLSKGAAFYRKTAAELIQRFPELVAPLRDGRLCLSSVIELAKVLSRENLADVLPRFFHRSKSEAKAVSAELAPAPAAPRRDVVTSLVRAERAGGARVASAAPPLALVHPDEPTRDRGQDLPAASADEPASEAPPAPIVSAAPRPPPSTPAVPAPARRDEAEPLTSELSRLHVTVSRRFLAKREAARSALSHSQPDASTSELLEAGLDLLLAQAAKRQGETDRPRREPRPAKPDHVPAHVKRAVWARDGGSCQWELDSGGKCGSRYRLELDHVEPRGRGGPPTPENLRLLCRVHNQYAARLAYGDEWMDRFVRGRAAPPGAEAGS